MWLRPGLAVVGLLAVSIFLAINRTPEPTPKPIAKVAHRPVEEVARPPRVATVQQRTVVHAEPNEMASDRVTAAPARASVALQPTRVAYHREDTPRQRAATKFVRTHRPAQHLAMAPEASIPPPQAVSPCDRLYGLDLARCMRPQVLDADQRLRNAYQDAVRAGVDRRVLVSYRRKWSKLRGRANSDPRSVTTGYRQIAQQLDVARTGQTAGGM